MFEELTEQIEKIEKLDAKTLHYLMDTYGTETVEVCLSNHLEELAKTTYSTSEEFYENQLKIWNKFGYYLACLEHNPWETTIIKCFEENSKKGSKTTNRLTIKEEVQYGFYLLNRSYIQLFLKPDDDITLDLRKIFASIKSPQVKEQVFETFHYLYQICHRASYFDQLLIKFIQEYQKQAQIDPLCDPIKVLDKLNIQPNKKVIETIDERELIEQLKMYTRYSIARNLFLEKNVNLAKKIASSYPTLEIDYNDLLQTGNEALIKATKKFDIRRQRKFSTYSYQWILKETKIVFQKSKTQVSISYKDQRKNNKIIGIMTNFYQENGRKPTIEELANATELSEEELKIYLLSIHNSNTISTNSIVNSSERYDNDTELIEMIPSSAKDPCASLIEEEASQGILTLIEKHVTPNQLEVLLRIYGLDNQEIMNSLQTAKDLNCTHQNVSSLMIRAQNRLRKSKELERIYHDNQ